MNAAEQANSIEIASKIAAVVNLFQSEFPDTSVDLSPWLNDAETAKFDDPHSLDFAFHFQKWDFACQSSAILMQIRLPETKDLDSQRLIGVELSGHDYMGQQWRFATIGNWEFWGITLPIPEAEKRLKHICVEILRLFNLLAPSSV